VHRVVGDDAGVGGDQVGGVAGAADDLAVGDLDPPGEVPDRPAVAGDQAEGERLELATVGERPDLEERGDRPGQAVLGERDPVRDECPGDLAGGPVDLEGLGGRSRR